MRTWNPSGDISRIIFQNLEFSLWPKVVSSGLPPGSSWLPGWDPGRKEAASPTHWALWFFDKCSAFQTVEAKGTVTKGRVGSGTWSSAVPSHYGRKRRFIILGAQPFLGPLGPHGSLRLKPGACHQLRFMEQALTEHSWPGAKLGALKRGHSWRTNGSASSGGRALG